MRRSDRDVGKLYGLTLLDNSQYATLMTMNPEGTPYGVPVSHVYFRDAIYFHCAPEGQKLRNIEYNPNVCLSCVGKIKPVPDFFSLMYESVIVTGKAEIVAEQQEKTDALMEICQKYAKRNIKQASDFINRLIDRTAVIKVNIESVTAKANKRHGK